MSPGPAEAAPDFVAITARQQATWSAGDFHRVARQVAPVAEVLVQAVDPHAGQRVLDVACGTGSVAIVAARRYCDTSGIDYVPALIEHAKRRAEAEALEVDFRVGDAQRLPYEDGRFDCVLSQFGVMFAPNQEKSAAEMLRVTKPGARIGLACWMPEGQVFDLFTAHAKRVPPPAGMKSPLRWGTEAGLRELYGDKIRDLRVERKVCVQYFRTIDQAVDTFRTYFGPTVRAYEAAGEAGAAELTQELRDIFARYNTATDGTVAYESVYLLSIALRA